MSAATSRCWSASCSSSASSASPSSSSWLVDPDNARPLSTRVLQPPSWALPFGSDRQGRNLFAVITTGTLLTLRIGLIAGFIGVFVSATLAFVSAYYGGWVDSLVRGAVDIGLTVPNLMVLIVVALTLREGMGVNMMALVIASLACSTRPAPSARRC